MKKLLFTLIICLTSYNLSLGQSLFQPKDIFELEYASDPQISPDGKQIAYIRRGMDIMKDRGKGTLWQISYDGTDHFPIAKGTESESQPRWSPSGDRLLFVGRKEGKSNLYILWTDTERSMQISDLQHSPANLSWSPDGKWIAYTAFVEEAPTSYINLPAKPKGAEWAEPAKYIDAVRYRSDGGGYTKPGFTQIFLLPSSGGTPRQLTEDEFNHSGPLNWTPDGEELIFSANHHSDRETQPRNSEIHRLNIASGELQTLTQRKGPDFYPLISPDGKQIAYLGYDDRYQGYQTTYLYLMDEKGKQVKNLTKNLDRSIEGIMWKKDGSGLFVQYSDEGVGKLAFCRLSSGNIEVLASDIGGTSLGRPYSSGSFSVSDNGNFAFTHTTSQSPSDIAVGSPNRDANRPITALNEDLLGYKKMAEVEEIWFESSFDQRKVQGWIVKPPDFDESKKYPLILEIHGGPFANYGPRFSAEMQLYAAAGYVVLYINPRGSTSYGEEFGNLIHHNYPSEDYDDLMSGVDAVIEEGYVDENNLYVTGGSGGGVLSSWIIGKTDRFQAAVVAKPVINWYSWALTADGYITYYQYWFPGKPWEHQDHYMKRSPISLVGNVKTPTMLLTGEVDYRTPISETEQYYQALKIQGVESAMVRIPEASHGIAARPSYLISKVLHVLKWFEEH